MQPTFRRGALLLALGIALGAGAKPPPAEPRPLFNDSHFHLTNYVQKGPSLAEHLRVMGDAVGRSTLFGIPLQQTWSWGNSGIDPPTYYLHTDAPLYYYSFTDAVIATQWLSLDEADRARFDPMITGFNPADMYAADHIRRVLETYPGVFVGIGEFSIHKEFVSAKVAGETASLTDPALDKILDFAAEVGLVVLLHCDVDAPFPHGDVPIYLDEIKALFARHPGTTIIWAHTGLGRVVSPLVPTTDAARSLGGHIGLLEAMLSDPQYDHVVFDISWDEIAKYVVASKDTVRATAALLDRYPDRFLFGTDTVAPTDQASYLSVYEIYRPLWSALDDEARGKVLRGNYERVFDAARVKVRAWEQANVPESP